jgi:alginate O-acetyltransferase complex protein AlgI
MLFNSLHFLAFFPVVLIGYFSLPGRHRWLWLLAASCYFYMAFIPEYLLILVALILIDYSAALLIDGAQGARRKQFLVLSLIANLGLLGFFKGASFIGADIILPIGLSFHTFQSMSYTIEVYRGTQKPERHLGLYALYVLFWPQLVAGPIERPGHLLPQLRLEHRFDAVRAGQGVRLMLLGFARKVLVADPLGTIVDPIYKNPSQHSGLTLAIATWAFMFQVYCDFAGYSDIARGAARVMGFELVENFRLPFYSQSIAELWRRWHISLANWFRDYVYIPLGGGRGPWWRTTFNLMVTATLSGAWHGANWTFVAWGALHGVYIVIAHWMRAGRPTQSIAWRVVRTLFTFNLLCSSVILFRARSLADSFEVTRRVFGGRGGAWSAVMLDPRALILPALVFIACEATEYLWRKRTVEPEANLWTLSVRYSAAFGVALWVLMRLTDPSVQAHRFVYFAF